MSLDSHEPVFTDDDLAELQDLTKATIYWSPKIPALLARLEAAEEALVRLMYIPSEYRTSGMTRAIYKWMKSAGKCL